MSYGKTVDDGQFLIILCEEFGQVGRGGVRGGNFSESIKCVVIGFIGEKTGIGGDKKGANGYVGVFSESKGDFFRFEARGGNGGGVGTGSKVDRRV